MSFSESVVSSSINNAIRIRKIIPSALESSSPIIPSTSKSTVIKITNGISYLNVFFLIASAAMQDATPSISSTFIILLPITFPTEIPALPDAAPLILTAASGSDVPNATIVSPITI